MNNISPNFPEVGENPNIIPELNPDVKITTWVILLDLLIVLVIFFILKQKRNRVKNNENKN